MRSPMVTYAGRACPVALCAEPGGSAAPPRAVPRRLSPNAEGAGVAAAAARSTEWLGDLHGCRGLALSGRSATGCFADEFPSAMTGRLERGRRRGWPTTSAGIRCSDPCLPQALAKQRPSSRTRDSQTKAACYPWTAGRRCLHQNSCQLSLAAAGAGLCAAASRPRPPFAATLRAMAGVT